MRRSGRPVVLIAGVSDKVFYAREYEGIIRKAGRAWPVNLIPDIAHIGLVLETAALKIIVEEIQRLHSVSR